MDLVLCIISIMSFSCLLSSSNANTHTTAYRNPPKPPKKPPILNGTHDIIVSDGGKFNDDKHRRYLLAQVRFCCGVLWCSRFYELDLGDFGNMVH